MPKAASRSSKSSKSHAHAPAAKFSGAPVKGAAAGSMPFDAGALAGPGGMDFASFVGQSSTEALKNLAGGPSMASTSLDSASILSSGDPHAAHITKKDKRALKREALLSRLNPDSASASPYSLSSSAARRAKRKAKTELTGGSLSALTLALNAGPTTPAPAAAADEEDEWYGDDYEATSRKARKEQNRKAASAAAADDGKIGEGKGRPMSAKARSKAVQAEALRAPRILAHPSFRANPWATIRQHAGNSLVMKQPEPPKPKKQTAQAPVAGAGSRGWGGRAADDEMEMDV